MGKCKEKGKQKIENTNPKDGQMIRIQIENDA